MTRTYYECWLRLDKNDLYVIWHDGCGDSDRDGVIVVNENGTPHIPSFSTTEALRTWASEHGLTVADSELRVFDLDVVQKWLRNPRKKRIDPVIVLNAWNLFIDVRASLENRDVLRNDKVNDALYHKVFWGNNLPSVTPPGKHYEPIWTDEEAARLHKILEAGLRQFRSAIKTIPLPPAERLPE